MGFLSGLFNPAKNQKKALARASANFKSDTDGYKRYLTDMLDVSGDATGVYSDALGLNGQGAQQTVQDNFMTGPGYQARVDAGQEAIDASSIFGGTSQSGKTLASLAKMGRDEYANEFDNYLTRIGQMGGQGYQAGSGLTGLSQEGNRLLLERGRVKDEGNAAGLQNAFSIAKFGLGMLT